MLKTISIIIIKELKLIVRNRGVWIVFLLPTIIFPIINIGTSYFCNTNSIIQQKYNISIIGENKFYNDFFENQNIIITKCKDPLKSLTNNDIDLIINLDKSVITYNSKNILSLIKANTLGERLQQYSIQNLNIQKNILCRIENEKGFIETVDISLNKFLMPIVFIVFVSNSCSNYADDMFAGEKEKGTLEILFSSKLSKSTIFLGKVFSLIIIELLSTIISLISFNISAMGKQSLDINDMLYLFLSAISLGCISSFVSLSISLFSRNVRESQIINSFVLSIPVTLSVFKILYNSKAGNWIYTIPIINSIELITNSLSNNGNMVAGIITFLTNIALCIVISFVSIRYMKKEVVLQT
ncbi:MAG: ABC transporter permease subunit [Clostridia bacterium]|nr:ABC transporter permease subunit [Clostridia bacterium]